jgi:hypothetical protein
MPKMDRSQRNFGMALDKRIGLWDAIEETIAMKVEMV